MPFLRREAALTLGRVFVLGLSLLLAACGNKKSPPGEAGPSSSGAAGPAAAPLQMEDLAGVCAGKGEPRAKPFTKAGAAAHAMIAFEHGAEKPEFSLHLPDQLTNFRPEKAEEVELVACVVRSAQHKIETCSFDSTPPARYLDMNDATYDISIREATTGTIVVNKTVTLPAEPCPRFHTFFGKGEKESTFPSSDYALTEMARSLVLPAAGGIGLKLPNPEAGVLKLDDRDLDRVCYGFPETRAAAYDKTPGKVSPTILFTRVNDNARYNSSTSDSDLKPWLAESAARYQLVLCATEKSRTKKKECKFDDTQPVHLLDMYSATFDVTLREAKTAKVLATKVVTEEASAVCPTMWFFKSPHDSDVPSAVKPIMDFTRPFTEPK